MSRATAPWLAPAAVLLLTPLARGDDDADKKSAEKARAIVERAIKACGGAEALDKFASRRLKVRGTFKEAGQTLAATGEWVVIDADRFKWDYEYAALGQKFRSTVVRYGEDTEWVLRGQVMAMTEANREEVKSWGLEHWVMQLTALRV